MLDTYRDLSATATFNQWAGLDVVRLGEGECDLRMPWRADEMGQYSGFLHAGLIAASLDTACGFAANTMARGGVLSSHVAINCLAPAGELSAVHDGRSKLVATASVFLVPTGD